MPEFKIDLRQNAHVSRTKFFTPGVYRVPEDMSEHEADVAVKEAGATRVEFFRPEKASPKPAPVRRQTRKSAAPANKSADVAENKAADDDAAVDGPALHSGGDGAIADT